MNALTELNGLRKLAKAAGIVGYNKMKLIELRELGLGEVTEPVKTKTDDPFDDIDESVEGDHLTDRSVGGQAASIRITREAWLQAAIDALRPMFAQVGAVVPDVHASVGFPSTNVRKRIGECWHGAEGELHQIFVSPVLDDIITVLGVLVHELVHAALPQGTGHGKAFGTVARALGLEGKMTATTVGDTLKDQLKELVAELGDYPHVKLTLGGTKKQTTRMLKVECNGAPEDADEETEAIDPCGFIFRTTAKWIATFDGCKWKCPCGGNMVPEIKEETGDDE